MNDVQVGKFSALLHKLLDMGEGSPTPTLAPELFAFLGLEVDRPEWEFLKGTKLCAGYDNVAAGGAGNRSMVGIRNPTGSGALVVLHTIQALAAQDYLLVMQNLGDGSDLAAFTATGTRRVMDFRAGVAGLGYSMQPGCSVIKSNTTAIKGSACTWIMPDAGSVSANRYFHWKGAIVLPPNSAVFLAGQADNVALYAGFWWREQSYSPMELQSVNPRLR